MILTEYLVDLAVINVIYECVYVCVCVCVASHQYVLCVRIMRCWSSNIGQ